MTPDYCAQGRIAVDTMAKELPNSGNTVYLGDSSDYEVTRLSYQGLIDQVKEKGYKLTQLCEFTKCDRQLTLGKNSRTAFLAKIPDQIHIVCAADDGTATATSDAAKDGKHHFAMIYQSPMYEAPATFELDVTIFRGEKGALREFDGHHDHHEEERGPVHPRVPSGGRLRGRKVAVARPPSPRVHDAP